MAFSDTGGVNNQPVALSDTDGVNNQPVALSDTSGVNNICGLLVPPIFQWQYPWPILYLLCPLSDILTTTFLYNPFHLSFERYEPTHVSLATLFSKMNI